MATVARTCYFCGEPQVKVGSKIHQVLELLYQDAGFSWTPREISDRLGLHHQTVRTQLHRLVKADLIRVRRHKTALGPRNRYFASQAPTDRSWPPTLTAGHLCSCGEFLSNPNGNPIRIVLDAHKQAHLYGARR